MAPATRQAQLSAEGVAVPAPARVTVAFGRANARGRRSGYREHLQGWAFVLPYFLCFCAFVAAPIIFGIDISLHHWNGITGAGPFAGGLQYTRLFNDSTPDAQRFWADLGHTALFVGISVPLLWAVPTAVAYLIFLAPLKGLFRVIFFAPVMLSPTAVGVLWAFLLGNTGAVNTLLGLHVTWLVSQPYAWISIDIATLWWTLGVNMVIMYAAISQIPGTSVEAATLDGASHFGLFRRIVLPQVKPVSLVVIVLATIASFNLFAQSYIMTGGGPGTSTETLSMWIWRTGFDIFNLGSASAMAFVMGVILLAIGIAEYAYIRRGSLR